MKNFINNYLNQRNRNIISIFIIILGIIFIYNYTFNSPTYINKYIATNIYKNPANSSFTDQILYNCVIDAYNKNNSEKKEYTDALSDSELASITYLNCSNNQVSNASGIEKLINIKTLILGYNELSSIDVSKNTALTTLQLASNKLTSIDVSNNKLLTLLDVAINKLSKIDISKNTELLEVRLYTNQLTNLDVSNNIKLKKLNVYGNLLEQLNTSKLVDLEELYLGHYYYNECNKIKSLDLSNNKKLSILRLRYNLLSSIDISKNTELKELDVSYTKITSLDTSKNINLKKLTVGTYVNFSNGNYTYTIPSSSGISSLDLSNNPELTYLDVNNCILTDIDVSNNHKLEFLNAKDNRLTSLDLSNNTNLRELNIPNNRISSLDLSNNPKLVTLVASYTQLTYLDVSNNPNLEKLDVHNVGWCYGTNCSGNTNLQMKSLDLRNNSKLKRLALAATKFYNSVAIYKGGQLDVVQSSVRLANDNPNTIKSISVTNSNLKLSGKYISSNVAGKYSVNNISFINNYYGTSAEGINYFLYLDIYVIEATSNKYKIGDNYIYTGLDTDNNTIINNIKLNYGKGSIENNKYIIKYDNEIVKEFDIINISTNKYDLSKEYIYFDNNDINSVKDNINVVNGNILVNNNKLDIKYKDTVLNSYDLVGILSDKYDIKNNSIYVLDDYQDSNLIKSNITCINCNLDIKDNELNIKYKNEVIYTYLLSSVNNYVDINDYLTNDDNMIIYRINNTTVSTLLSKVESNGVLSLIDNNGVSITNDMKLRTGYILRATFSGNTTDKLDYILSIRGDVLGTGNIDKNNARVISRHIVDKNVITGDEYLLSADYDGNGIIKMNDVMRMLRENR